MSERTTIVCTVGYPGSGKSLFADIAQEEGFSTVSMGDAVRSRAQDALNDPTGDEIGEWATKQREKYGGGIVASWVVDHIRDQDTNTVIVDGLRSPESMEMFEDAFDEVILVHITADQDTRLARLESRKRDDEQDVTREYLQRRDTREDAVWGMGELINDNSTIEITNESTLEHYRTNVMNLLEELQQ